MINAMREAGLDPGSIIADGKIHRFDVPGDRAKSENGWFVLYDGDIQAGRFGSWKTGQSEKWCSKTAAEFTPEEKKQYASRMEAARREREKEQQRVQDECRIWCTEAWNNARPADSNHPYLLKKQVISYGLRQSGDALMVPVMNMQGVKHGLQFIQPDGTKKFKTGTAKQGNFHLIGKPIENTMIICEGYATGASIHHATGHAVLVAFDAGNLKPVAEYIHKERPALNLIIAADDDQWTDGNPGIAKASEAARAVKAELRRPRFLSLDTKPTDFNDLHALYGASVVKTCIFPPPVEEYNPNFTVEEDYQPTPEEFYNEDKSPNPFNGAPFKLLGYNHGEYYYLPHGTKQIKILKAPEHTKSNLMEIARLQYWEGSDYASKSGFDVDKAANALIQLNQGLGVYDAAKIRGRGAWEDEGRSVLHMGNKLIVNNDSIPIGNFQSKYVYEAATQIGFGTATRSLPKAEAIKLVHLCDALAWEKEINGRLLAGWCIASFICGALSWRPHIHITGGAGSGKTWIVDNIVRPSAGPGALVAQGATTEAGIRQALGKDARPVIYDEAEGEDKNAQQRMQSILELARQASTETGGSIYKGSTGGRATSFRIRSCFCFSSIGISSTQQADQSRITVLTLKNRNDNNQHFNSVILPGWKAINTNDFWESLRTRSIKLIPEINANAKIFSDSVANATGSKRTGDQLGALLACAYSLYSDSIIDRTAADNFISKYDWQEHKIDSEQTDERRCLSAILETTVPLPNGHGSKSIAEMIQAVSAQLIPDEKDDEHLILKRYGVKVVQGGFLISNSHAALKRILEKTPWANNWHKILERLPGGHKQAQSWFSGGSSRATMLPIHYATGEE